MAEKPPPASTEPPKPITEPGPAPLLEKDPEKVNPTRYGDWEKNGRCIDF